MEDFSRYFFQYYNAETNAERASWVVDRCIGPQHTLHTIVPSGFSSYVRILHPGLSVNALAPDDEKRWSDYHAGWQDWKDVTPVRWTDTAIENNRVPHRLMQWFDACPSQPIDPSVARINPPFEGELTKEIVKRLFEVLIDYSGADQGCICGFWEGSRVFDAYNLEAKFESYSGQQNYLLFNSTLAGILECWLAAHEFMSSHHMIETAGWAPNAVWPTSCEWYLAIPYQHPSSYFGGSVNIACAIRDAEGIESYEALPGDNIWTARK